MRVKFFLSCDLRCGHRIVLCYIHHISEAGPCHCQIMLCGAPNTARVTLGDAYCADGELKFVQLGPILLPAHLHICALHTRNVRDDG